MPEVVTHLHFRRQSDRKYTFHPLTRVGIDRLVGAYESALASARRQHAGSVRIDSDGTITLHRRDGIYDIEFNDLAARLFGSVRTHKEVRHVR